MLSKYYYKISQKRINWNSVWCHFPLSWTHLVCLTLIYIGLKILAIFLWKFKYNAKASFKQRYNNARAFLTGTGKGVSLKTMSRLRFNNLFWFFLFLFFLWERKIKYPFSQAMAISSLASSSPDMNVIRFCRNCRCLRFLCVVFWDISSCFFLILSLPVSFFYARVLLMTAIATNLFDFLIWTGSFL